MATDLRTAKPAAGRVALITGSGKRRVGWHVAEALAQRGYSLIIHYHTSAKEAEDAGEYFRSLGVGGLVVQADLTNEKAARGMVQAAMRHFGRLDVLVNCASIWKSKRLEDITAADVRTTFETNLLSTFVCCQEAGLAMVGQEDGGSIINMGDWAEIRPYLHYAAYFASKGAIPALTRTFAVELGTRNPRVRVNCILPGPVLFMPEVPESERQQAIQATLTRRAGKPENVAQAVLFLVDNDFITGVSLPVDGGRSVYAGGA
jgi:pteridine reductase